MSNNVSMTESQKRDYYSHLKTHFHDYTEKQCNDMSTEQTTILYEMLDDETDTRVKQWLLLGKALIEAQKAPLTIVVKNELVSELVKCIRVVYSQKAVYQEELDIMQDIANNRSKEAKQAAKFLSFCR